MCEFVAKQFYLRLVLLQIFLPDNLTMISGDR